MMMMMMMMKVTQSCPTLYDLMDYIVHGILQARILKWIAFPFSRGSSQPRDRTQVSRIAGGFVTSWATREAQSCISCLYILEVNPLLVVPFVKNFSYFVCCLFILFMVSFAVQKLLNLIKSHLFIFVFIFITWFIFKYLIRMVPSCYFPAFSFPLFFYINLEPTGPLKNPIFI